MRLFMLAALLLASAAAQAQREYFRYEGPDEKAWAEAAVQLPAPPREERLVPFFVGEAVGHRHFVDRDSVSVGADGVVRYTLVIRTTGGATNVTYEGIRCSEAELKVYAMGAIGSDWTLLREPKWRPIRAGTRQTGHVVLYHDFFCPDQLPPRDAHEAVAGLLRGQHWRAGPGLLPQY